MTVTGLPTSAPSHIELLREGSKYWIQNQRLTKSFIGIDQEAPLCWVSIGIALMVMGHSFYINKYKLTAIRIMVDTVAVGIIISAVACLVLIANPTPENFVYASYTTAGVVGAFLCQVPDNIIFLLGYLSLHKNAALWLKIAAVIYIIVFLYLAAGILEHTIYPLFINENSRKYYWTIHYFSYVLYATCLVIYDFAFTFHFLQILYQVHVKKTKRVPRNAQIFVIKCCIHCIIRYLM